VTFHRAFTDVEEAMISLACSSPGTSLSSGSPDRGEFVDSSEAAVRARIPGTSSRLDQTTKPVVCDESHVSTGSTNKVVGRRIGERTASTAPEGNGP